jgi:hypothetical protein
VGNGLELVRLLVLEVRRVRLQDPGVPRALGLAHRVRGPDHLKEAVEDVLRIFPGKGTNIFVTY